MIQVHFSDFFSVESETLETYGAFNISLINDLPLFVDPFLLFNSEKDSYRALHENIIRYLRFLRDKSADREIRRGLLQAWFTFPEVKQNWLGYSEVGNAGRGLGQDFAESLHRNLNTIFTNFGNEQITNGSHLEKLCLIEGGVGCDNISDFTVNLIKEFILHYTQNFTLEYIAEERRRSIMVQKVRFDYSTERWLPGQFVLPFIDDDFLILTPKDILTKDEAWINKSDMISEFHDIASSLPNEQLRAQINNYILRILPEDASKKEERAAIETAIRMYPEFIEYFILSKEESGEEAVAVSDLRVNETECVFVHQTAQLIQSLLLETSFYQTPDNTLEETRQRVNFLKNVIENKGGYRAFYSRDEPIQRERDLHIFFRLTWFGTPSDVSTEVNNGRGHADFKISRGAWDKTIVEFKLASNRQLKRNLVKQAEIYQRASDAQSGLKVIVYFSELELDRVDSILTDLGLSSDPNVILIDARADNKPSASRA